MGSSYLPSTSPAKDKDPRQPVRAARAAVGPFCLLAAVGAAHGRWALLVGVAAAPLPRSRFQSGRTQRFVTASAADKRQARIVVICLQMFSMGRRPTPLPPLQELLLGIAVPPSPPPPPPGQIEHAWAPQAVCTQPGTGLPSLWPHVVFTAWKKLGLRGEEQEAVTLQQVTPFLTAFLFRQSLCGQEVGFPETSAGELIAAEWERLDSRIVLRKPPRPPKEHHCLQGFVTAANLLQARVHLTQQSISRSGQWQRGKSRKKAIIYDAAP